MSRQPTGQRVVAFILSALAVSLTSQISYAGTSTVMGTWASGDPLSEVPTIPTPAGTQRTTWTLYNGGTFHFVAYPFTVDTTGIYSATASTPVVVDTTYFLAGVFTPGAPPSTPIGNFFAGIYTGSVKTAGQYTANFFESVSDRRSTQYTALVAYNTGGSAGENFNGDDHRTWMYCDWIQQLQCFCPGSFRVGLFHLGDHDCVNRVGTTSADAAAIHCSNCAIVPLRSRSPVTECAKVPYCG